MLCSIVIPLYNKAAYIATAVQSVLAQTHQQFEIIVVDDGSTDDGAALASQIRDARITIIRQANAGVSCARNRGIACATGELVCFLDADDVYQTEYLATIVAMARQHPGIDYFATAYRRIPTDGGSCWHVLSIAPTEVIKDCFETHRRHGAIFFTSSVAVRRQKLNQMQPCFPPGETLGEDLDLWFRLGEISLLAYCPTALTGYRVGLKDSLTSVHAVHTLLPAWKRLEMRALYGQAPPHLRGSILKLLAHERIMLARSALSNGYRGDGLSYLFQAWRGMSSSQWWVTLGLAILNSPLVVQQWSRWRSARADGR